MTPFLAHVLTFCQRDEPYDQATFNSEDYLSPGDEALRFDDLGRSGLQIQHCFNLIGVEQDPGEPWPYLYRQSAVYFSFDPIQNRSLCLILKANKELRKRIEEWTRSVCPGTPLSNLSSLESSFSSTLNTHSIIIQWSLENWASYIGFLEAEASESSSLVKYTPVDCITQEHNIHNDISRRSTFQSKSQTRKYSRLTKHLSRVPRSQSWKALVEVGRMLQEVGKRDKPNGSERLWNAATLPTTNMMDQLDINQIFTFQQLQDLHQLSAQVDKAIMILGQNKSVLSEMVERFESLEGSKRFSRFVNVENTNIKGFFRRSRKGLRDLANQEARLRALQAGLDKDISLVSTFGGFGAY